MTSTPRRRAARLAAPFAALALLAPLAGCAEIVGALQGESSREFATRDALQADWAKDADWLPADASEITTHESVDGDPASLVAVSSSALDPSLCAEVPRQSAPLFSLPDTPDVYKTDRVFACGDWAVIATDAGWYGWTPNHPDEKAQSPAS